MFGSRCSTLCGRAFSLNELCRVNFEVNNLKPFPHLAFPHFLTLQNAPKQPSFDGELMASCVAESVQPLRVQGMVVKWRFSANNRIVIADLWNFGAPRWSRSTN